MSSCVPVIVKLPGLERDMYRKRPALRVSPSNTTPIDVAIVPVCTCFVASVHFLCILVIHVTFVSLQVLYHASVPSAYKFSSLISHIQNSCLVKLSQ
jgi:hypothetical protein